MTSPLGIINSGRVAFRVALIEIFVGIIVAYDVHSIGGEWVPSFPPFFVAEMMDRDNLFRMKDIHPMTLGL